MHLPIATRTALPSPPDNQYVRPVRVREGSVSIEVNLSPNAACPFACDYCLVPRGGERAFPEPIDLHVLEGELRRALELYPSHASDVTFAGSGEPTWCPQFEQAMMVAQACVRCFASRPVPVRVLTCGGTLERAHVARALESLVSSGDGEVWVKLDAWDDESYERINGARVFDRATGRILGLARHVPVVLQTLVAHRPEAVPVQKLGENLANAIRRLVDAGARIERVELTTVARKPAKRAKVWQLSAVEMATVAAEIAGIAPVRVAH